MHVHVGCVHVYTGTHADIWMHGCWWRSWVSFLGTASASFEPGSLLVDWNDGLISLMDPLDSVSPVPWWQPWIPAAGILTLTQGIELRSSYLKSKRITDWVISPSLLGIANTIGEMKMAWTGVIRSLRKESKGLKVNPGFWQIKMNILWGWTRWRNKMPMQSLDATLKNKSQYLV